MSITVTSPVILPLPISDGGTGATTAAQARTNLGVVLGSRTIIGTTNQIDVTNGSGIVGNPIISLATDPIIPANGSVTIPVGDNSQRPVSPTLGMIRGNTDTNLLEGYSNGEWSPFNLPFSSLQFVAKGGDDANSGTTLNSPKLTIQAAIDAISDGGLVWVLDAGQYSENITITKGMQLWAPNAELDGTGSGDLITVSGGGTTVVRATIGDINQGGPGLAVNIPDTGTVLFLNAAILLGSVTCNGNLIVSDIAQIVSTVHITSTGTLATYITNALGCTFIFDAGSTIVGNIQSISGPGMSTNTVYGGQFFNDLVQISDGFVVTSLDTTISYTDLSSGGQVNVITSANPIAVYQLNGITLNGFGTNFSGGDRDLQITDGTNIWTIIPAATLQTLVNARWGSADVPFPVSIPLNQKTVAGTNLYAQYANGTSDYTDGQLVITLVYERVI